MSSSACFLGLCTTSSQEHTLSNPLKILLHRVQGAAPVGHYWETKSTVGFLVKRILLASADVSTKGIDQKNKQTSISVILISINADSHKDFISIGWDATSSIDSPGITTMFIAWVTKHCGCSRLSGFALLLHCKYWTSQHPMQRKHTRVQSSAVTFWNVLICQKEIWSWRIYSLPSIWNFHSQLALKCHTVTDRKLLPLYQLYTLQIKNKIKRKRY